mmetsp:Transcript_17390/g.49784  ORF Transcript_17390/g.49784 Transcript_17390/m.49784 type:complete len:220 (+) Transcript_17390:476-1135(+)
MVEPTLEGQIAKVPAPEALADHERFDAAIPRAAGFGHRHAGEEEAELSVQQSDVPATEDLGHEASAFLEDVRGDVDGAQQQLALDVFVDVVQPRHVGGTVADDQFGPLAVEVPDDALGGFEAGNVALDAVHARQGCHGLQIDRHNLHVFLFFAVTIIVFLFVLLLLVIPALVVIILRMDQPVGQHLRPRARRRAEVDGPPDAAGTVGRLLGAEEVELLI